LKSAPGNVDVMRMLARGHDQLGRMVAIIGVEEGLRSTERAVQIREELNFIGVGSRAGLGELGSSYATLGMVKARMGKTGEALAAYQKSLAMQERLASMKKDDVATQRTVMIAMSHVGDTLGNSHMINLGRFKEAAAIYERVVEKARWLVSVDRSDKKAQVDLSFGLLRYGNTLLSAGDAPAGLRAMTEARQLLESLIQDDPGNARLAQNLASLVFQFGEMYASSKQWDKAVSHTNEAVRQARIILKADPRDTITSRLILECFMVLPEMNESAGRKEAAVQSAIDLERHAQAGVFTRSKEPRVRSLVAKAFETVARYIPARSKELLERSDAEWAAMEKEGLMVPALVAERDGFRKRLAAAR